MRATVLLVILAFAFSSVSILARPAEAQAASAYAACEWFPSSDCQAPGSAGTTSRPCYSSQIKADWNTMVYHMPWQASYRSVGAGGSYSDVWCFDYEQQAIYYGFRRATG